MIRSSDLDWMLARSIKVVVKSGLQPKLEMADNCNLVNIVCCTFHQTLFVDVWPYPVHISSFSKANDAFVYVCLEFVEFLDFLIVVPNICVCSVVGSLTVKILWC